MNWLLLGAGGIFAICVIVGICRGAVRIAVSLAATIITLVVVFFATPFVADGLKKFTPVDEMIEKQVISTMADMAASQVKDTTEKAGLTADKVKKVLEAAGIGEDQLAQFGISIDDIVNGNISSDQLAEYGISSGLLEGLGEKAKDKVEDAVENAEIPRDVQMAAIQQADLPDVFKSLLTTNNNSEVYDELGAGTFAQYVGKFLSGLIINIVAFLATFILVTIILRAIIYALDFISELPVLGVINHLAGGAVGIIIALVIIWTILVIITLLFTTGIGKQLFDMINDSSLLKMLYTYNPIMKMATNFL